MKTKHTGSLIVFLLALVMMLGMMPLTAHAVTEISSVSTSIMVPAVGTNPNGYTLSGNSSAYDVDVTKWYKGDELNDVIEISSSHKFQANATYWAQVEFTPNSGYSISRTAIAKINGKTPFNTTFIPDTGKLRCLVYYTPTTLIPSLSATLTAPVAGAAPVSSATPGYSARYTISEVSWYKGNTYDSSTRMVSGEKFEVGETYFVAVEFRAKDGFSFESGHATKNIPVTFNGKTATFEYASYESGILKYASFYASFTAPAAPLATPTNLRWDGTTAKWDAVTGAAEYIVQFYKNNVVAGGFTAGGGKTSYDGSVNVKSRGAGTYTFTVTAKPASSDSAHINSAVSAQSAGLAYPIEISSVYATVTAPVGGATLSTSVTIGDSVNYSVEFMVWRKGSGDITYLDQMSAGDRFEAGKTYNAIIKFVAKDGYCFRDSANVFINTESATFFAHTTDANGDIETITYYYAFTASTVIPSVSVTATLPKAGDVCSSTYPPMPICDGNKCGIAGYGVMRSAEVSDSNEMDYGDIFEDGKTYWYWVLVWPGDGYLINETTVVKINNQTAVRDSCIPYTEYENWYGYYKISFVPAHTHTPATAWTKDAANHWHTCSGCSELLDKAAHSYGAWTVTKAATETATGSRERTCSVCGYKQTEVIPMLSHTHAYTGAWKSDATNHWQLCSCGEKGNTAAHTYGAWKVTKAATETATGSRERVCAVCGYKQTEVIPMLSHTHSYTGTWKSDATNHWQLCSCGEKGNTAAHAYGAWKVTKAATETADGSRERVCSVCGYKQTEVIPMLSHTHAYGTEWKNDDTQHWHECDCGDKSGLDAHTFGEWTVTKEATEDEEGLQNRTCSACGYVESSVIPALGHEHSYSEEWKSDATNHWNECDCGEKSNAAAHTFGEWETVKEATETEEGSKKRACSVCGYEEYEAIAASGTVDTAEPDTAEPDTADTVAPGTEPTVTDPETPDGSFPWWIIVVSAVAAGGITAVIIVIIKKKKDNTKEGN